jgi:hypothetical protein
VITQARTFVGVPADTGAARWSSVRVAAVFEPSRAGVAVLAEATALHASRLTELTVVVMVPQASSPHRCSPSPRAFNDAVRDAATADLHRAARLLGHNAEDASLLLLLEGQDLPLHEWVLQNGIDLVLLPARRGVRRTPRHPATRRLRDRTEAQVRIVPA